MSIKGSGALTPLLFFIFFIMEKGIYSDNFVIKYNGVITRFSTLKSWIEYDEIDYSDIQPASYEEITSYLEVQKRTP